MNFFKFFTFILTLNLVSTITILADTKIDHKIVVIVNEEMITSYDVLQRMKLNALLQGIEINEQNNQIIANNVVDELIHEKLKKQKINEYNVKINEDEFKNFELNFFKKNELDKESLLYLFELNKINFVELKELLENEFLWNKLVNGLYIRLTSVSELEIDELISKNPTLSLELAKNLVIQRQLDLKSGKLLRDMMNEATIEYR